MSVINYLGSLLPSYEASSLKDDLDANAKELTGLILPAYEALAELIAGGAIRDKAVAEHSAYFVKEMRDSELVFKNLRNPNMFEYVAETIKNIGTLTPYLRDRIDKDIGRKLITNGITFNRQTLLQFCEVIEFFSTYAKIFINYATHAELASVDESRIKVRAVGPDDIEYLQLRRHTFTVVCRILGTPVTKLAAEYGEIPDMAIDADSFKEVQSVIGSSRIDPMGFASVPFPISIVYHARMKWADYQMDRYDDTVSTAKAVEYRVLLYRKRIDTGEGDASIERLLEIQEDRLMELRRKRERLEVKYGLS